MVRLDRVGGTIGPMLHDVKTLYIAAAIIVAIFAGALLSLFGAPGWAAFAATLWLAVTCIVAITRHSKPE